MDFLGVLKMLLQRHYLVRQLIHQNDDQISNTDEITIFFVAKLKSFSFVTVSVCDSHHFSYKNRLLLGTPAGLPGLCLPVESHFHWSQPREGNDTCRFSASPLFEQSRLTHKSHRSSRQQGIHSSPEYFPGGSYSL